MIHSFPFPDPHGRPKYVRLPPNNGREHYTGLSRSALNALILPCRANEFKPPVKSKVLKSNKHAARGVRLICLESLLGYIEESDGTSDAAPDATPAPQ